ncbi:hypothetical protein HAX54_023099 [Datura stramonium]|uniref:Uncharacterized protein n=1 Tax=Datura stramonium TaxID=4076 RepID=A0ABS8UWF7_DATST|nr:hypothetical protein [Datura stramonium]
MLLLLSIPVRGEMVDISVATINRILCRPNFMSPTSTTKFYYKMRERHDQHWWLAQRSSCPNTRRHVETPTTKKYDLEKSKDETRYDLKLHKPFIEVFRFGVQSARVAKENIDPAGAAIGTKFVGHAAEIPTATPSTSANFSKMLRKEYIHEKQLKLFAEQLGTFVDRAITTSLDSYVSLHSRIDDMETPVNDRLKDLTVLDLAKFAVEFKEAQDDIAKLQ